MRVFYRGLSVSGLALLLTGMILIVAARQIGQALPSNGWVSIVRTQSERGSLLLLDVDRQVTHTVFLPQTPYFYDAEWSPDCSHIAFTPTGSTFLNRDITVFDWSRNQMRFISEEGQQPHWSPNGEQIAYLFNEGAVSEVRVTDVNTGNTTPIDAQVGSGSVSWMGDHRLLFIAQTPFGYRIAHYDLLTHTATILEPEGEPQGFVRALPSADGALIAAVRNPDGRVYVINADGADFRYVSTSKMGAARLFRWSPNDPALLYYVTETPSADLLYRFNARTGDHRLLVEQAGLYVSSFVVLPDERILMRGVDSSRVDLIVIRPDRTLEGEIALPPGLYGDLMSPCP